MLCKSYSGIFEISSQICNNRLNRMVYQNYLLKWRVNSEIKEFDVVFLYKKTSTEKKI